MSFNTYDDDKVVGDAPGFNTGDDDEEVTGPVASIYKTAYSRGVNPDFLIGLAKLETRMGEATIKGDSDSYNLFNIKDMSGKGPRATDKAEGSRDAYRQYASYDDSANDLVDMLARKYPKALEAQTPEQFATALKQGGYATDPDYVNKVVRTINSVKRYDHPATDDAPEGMPNHVNLRALDAQMAERSAQAAPPTKAPAERTWREAATDTARSLTQGAIDVVGVLPGVAYGAATGNYDNAWLNTARGMNEVIQDQKSDEIKARRVEMDKKLSNAEGFTQKIVAGFVEGLADPTLLSDTLARSAPGMVAGGFAGKAAGTAADALGMTVLKNAAAQSGVISQGMTVASAAPRVAGATAVGTSAIVQGSSVASDAYEEAMKRPMSDFRALPEFEQLSQEHGEEQAKSILAGKAATRAGMVATAASLVAQKAIPGGDSIEKMFLPSTMREVADTVVKTGSSVLTKPVTKGMAGGVASQAAELGIQGVKTGLKEGLSEGLEEGSGAVAKDLELSRVGKDVNIGDSFSDAFGQAAAAGAVMGHVSGMRETAATKTEAIAAEGARLREMAAQRQADITQESTVDGAIQAAKEAQEYTSQSIANQILQLEGKQEAPTRQAPVEELPQPTSQPQPTKLATETAPEAVQPGPTFDASTLPILQQERLANGTQADKAIQSKPQEAPAETAGIKTEAAAQAQAAQDAGIRAEVARMREIMDARRQAEQQAALEAMPNTSPAKQVTATSGNPVIEKPVKDLKLSADVPQFKSDAGSNGVVDKLEGKYDRALAAPIQVWERLDGSLEVISGRHRLDLAQRSGEANIPTQIHREADGFTAQHATLLDTELNVKDGRGKVKDYVRYFQAIPVERSEATQRGLLQTAVGRDAYTIANAGSDELIASHNASQITDQAATQIAQAAPKNSALQSVGMRMVLDGKSITHAVNTMDAVKLMAQERGGPVTGDMFGFDDSSMRDAQVMAKIAGQEQAKASNTLAAVRGAAKRPELAAKEGVNINDPAALATRIQELEQQKSAWSNWATNPELVAQIRSKMDPQSKQPETRTEAPAKQEPSFDLTHTTPEQVKADEARAVSAVQAESMAKQDAENKARADAEVGEFRLTGSDRAADVAEAAGQVSLFDAPKAPTIEAAHAHIDSSPDLNTLDKAKARAALRKGDIEPGDILPKVQESGTVQASTESATTPQNENFKRWFDGSKVVDQDGKPLAMYHGTNKTANGEAISVFDTYGSNYGLFGQGQYFTDNPDVAASYTKKGKGESPTVYKVNLAIKNPIDMDANANTAAWQKAFPDVDFSDAISTNGKSASNEAMYRATEDHYSDQRLPKYEVAEAIQDGLRSMGHDGITHIGGGRFGGKSNEVRHRVYIAFEPEQIKSSTGNNGEYSQSNPDISRSTTASAPTEPTLTTRKTVRDAIAESLPKQARAIDRMIQRGESGKRGGMVVIEANTPEAIAKAFSEKTGRDYDAALVQVQESKDGKIQGFYDPKSGLTFVVAPNVTKGTAAAVALHEAYHGQQREAIDTKAQALLDSADDKLHTTATREVLAEARQKIADAKETGNNGEAAAYIIEAAAQRGREAGFSAVDGKFMDWVDKHIGIRVGGIIRDFVSMVRAHSLRIGLPINLHVDDLVAYAKLGLGRAAEGKTVAGDEVRYATAPQTPPPANTPPGQQQPAAPPSPTWDYKGSKADKLIYELQDGRIDLKRVQEAVKRSGQDINEKFDARLAETLYAGRVATRTDRFLKDDAAPLLEQMARSKVTMPELSDYLLARHAPERNAQIAKVNDQMPDGGAGTNSQGVRMTTQAATDYIANLPTETRLKMEALAQKVDAITKGTRDLLVSEGLEKQETIDAWNAAYKHYAPLFREDVDEGRPHSVGTGFSVRGDSSKRATGSDKKVDNMLAHVLMQREAAITRAEKNRVAMSLYGLALSSPNKNFWTTITPKDQKQRIMGELVAMGVDPVVAEQGMSGIPTTRTVDKITGKVVDRINPLYKSLPGAITVRVNGEDRVLMFNQKDENALRLAESLKNLDGLTKFDLAGNIVGKSTRWISSVNTQYNPAFGLVNSTRDFLGAMVNLSTTPLKGKQFKVWGNMGHATQGIYSALRGDTSGQWAKLYEQFQADGAQTGYKEMFKDVDARAKAIEKQIAGYDKAALSPGKAAHAVLSVLDGFNTIGENVVRLSAYKTALDNGMSRPEAAKLARELTVDFNRKGRMGRELGPLYAFFNASVQGTARTIESLKGPAGAKIISGGIALGMLQAVMLAVAGYDDDEIPDFVKSRNYVVPLGKAESGEKKYFLIPLPAGLNALPNIGRTMVELGRSGGKDFGKKTVGAIGEVMSALNPVGGGTVYTAEKGVDWGGVVKTATPTILDPVVELAMNKSFTGSDIEKTYKGEADNRPGYQRAREKTRRTPTGQMYVGITKALNNLTGGNDYEAGFISPSPEKVRYLAEAVGGGLLREIEKSVDLSMKVPGQKDAKVSGIPFIGRFYGETDSDAVAEKRYYSSVDKAKSAESSINLAKTAGDGDAIKKIYDKRPEAKSIDLVNRVQSKLTKLNKLAVSQINNDENIKMIDDARSKWMKATNKAILELEAQ